MLDKMKCCNKVNKGMLINNMKCCNGRKFLCLFGKIVLFLEWEIIK